MKTIKNLEEGAFLKLFFGFFSAAFLIAAVCMPDRNTMFSGLWQIMSQPGKISTNYFAVRLCRDVPEYGSGGAVLPGAVCHVRRDGQ